MRLLFVDVCARTVNPTNSLLPALLRLSCETVVYGPGFVSEATLSAGLETFVKERGPFDFYVTTRFDPEFDERRVRYQQRYMFPNYSSEILKRFGADLRHLMDRKDHPLIVFLTGLDPYAISEKTAEAIASIKGYLVAWASGFSLPLDRLDQQIFAKEEFFERKSKGGVVFGRWHDLIERYRSKFINLGHFVGEAEFDWRSLDMRSDKVVVPGQMYVRREAARRILAKAGMLTRTGAYKSLMSLMDHMRLRPHANPILVSHYNQTFVQSIVTSRYAYTDGCGYEIPIRKFFEVPALGAILLCTPCAGFFNLGFEHRKNAIVCAPDAILDALGWLRNHPEEAQRIAEAGRSLIWQQHSLHARAEQFARCVRSIVGDRYAGSRWVNGEFVVLETPAGERAGLQ